MAYTALKTPHTGDIISAARWNEEPVPPLSKRELKLECALTEIVSKGLGTRLDYATQAQLVHRKMVNGQWYDGITAKP